MQPFLTYDGEHLIADLIHWQLQGLASTSTTYYLGSSELVPLFLSQPSCSCAFPPRWTCRSTPAKSSTCSRAWSCTPWSPGTTPWQPSEAWAAACLECPTFFVWSFLFFCQECPPDPSVSRLQLRLTLWTTRRVSNNCYQICCASVSRFLPCLGNGQDEWWLGGGSILPGSCYCLCGTFRWCHAYIQDNVKQDGMWWNSEGILFFIMYHLSRRWTSFPMLTSASLKNYSYKFWPLWRITPEEGQLCSINLWWYRSVAVPWVNNKHQNLPFFEYNVMGSYFWAPK